MKKHLRSLFDLWNTMKKQLCDRENNHCHIKPREIWFVKMGLNIGNEQNGKTEFNRPVLVIKKVGNMFFTIAMTSKGKKKNMFYHHFNNVHYIQKHVFYIDKSFGILSQARSLDQKRFEEKIGIVDKDEFNFVKQKLRTLLL